MTIADGPLMGLKLRRAMGITTVLTDLDEGGYEAECLVSLKRLLRRGQVVYDVGAHSGLYTMFSARVVGETGRVIAVEAHPDNAAYIRDVLALNRIDNAQVVNAAVLNRTGRSKMLDIGNSSMYQLTDVATGGPEGSIDVELTTLELIASRYGDPDVIKMDIEGAEELALRGAENILRRKRPVLLVEVHSAEIAASLNAFLRGLGYRIYMVDGRELKDASWERFIIARADAQSEMA